MGPALNMSFNNKVGMNGALSPTSRYYNIISNRELLTVHLSIKYSLLFVEGRYSSPKAIVTNIIFLNSPYMDIIVSADNSAADALSKSGAS